VSGTESNLSDVDHIGNNKAMWRSDFNISVRCEFAASLQFLRKSLLSWTALTAYRRAIRKFTILLAKTDYVQPCNGD